MIVDDDGIEFLVAGDPERSYLGEISYWLISKVELDEEARERREAAVRGWLANAEVKILLRRSREEILRKYRASQCHLVAAESVLKQIPSGEDE